MTESMISKVQIGPIRQLIHLIDHLAAASCRSSRYLSKPAGEAVKSRLSQAICDVARIIADDSHYVDETFLRSMIDNLNECSNLIGGEIVRGVAVAELNSNLAADYLTVTLLLMNLRDPDFMNYSDWYTKNLIVRGKQLGLID